MHRLHLSICAICIGLFVFVAPVQAETPEGYTELEWISAPGITSFYKAPPNFGYIDYITVIDLAMNNIEYFATSTPRELGGGAVAPFEDDTAENWHYPRALSETVKMNNEPIAFMWNGPFFNTNMSSTVLSLALKATDEQGSYVSSGSRPENDMAEPRRMLLVDNAAHIARIVEFNELAFVSEGDLGIEGFDPMGNPSNRAVQASRVFLGVRNGGKELVVYCSRSASKDEASEALKSAGVFTAHQMQIDGGGSAMCGYNKPGQYFVESGRPLPLVMGATAVKNKGTITINNLNVRLGPGTSNASVRKITIGTEVTMYETVDGWIRISETEWVYAEYVRPIKVVPYAATVTSEYLNVRAGRGTGVAVTRRLSLAEEVTVLEELDGWVRISDTEWVFASYVE